MLKALTLLLLCGLLTTSHGLAQTLLSVAQVDKADLENLLSNILAEDGLLQGLTGGVSKNALRGLSGSQGGGVLGDVLGGQGERPLDGVLGGQGRGLLGDILGDEDHLWLKSVQIIPFNVTLSISPVIFQFILYTRQDIWTTSIMGMPLTLQAEVNTTANSQLVLDNMGNPKLLLESCRTNLGGIRILSGFLPVSLNNILRIFLNELMPGLLCPVADTVLNRLNTMLGTVNSVCPFGIFGNLHYTLAGLPLFKDQHIILNLNVTMTDRNGQPVDFPEAQNTSFPLPPAMDRTSQLMLPSSLLSSLLQMLVLKGRFHADLTDLTLRGSVPMTTLALRNVQPKLPIRGAKNSSLLVHIKFIRPPVVFLQNGKAMIQLGASLQGFSQSDSSFTPLFTVKMDISLSGSFSVTQMKLGIFLDLDSVSLSVADVGSFDENALKNWTTNILQIRYLPLINVGLNTGIPLPNIFRLNFANGVVETTDEMVVINKSLK